jgi:hypothetical protein
MLKDISEWRDWRRWQLYYTYEEKKDRDLLSLDCIVYREYIWKFELSVPPIGSVSGDSFKLVASSFD